MKLAVFGVSGFSQEVRDVALSSGYKEIVFIDKEKQENLGKFSVADENEVYTLFQTGYKFIIGIGSPKIRKNIRDRYPNFNYVNLIHPTATFGYGQLEEIQKSVGNIICAGTRITTNVKIGNFGIYNLNCTIGHECIIEDFVTISPGANISGNVRLSSGSYIGTNACILQGKSNIQKLYIGKNSIVGAGAVVTKNVPDHKIVKGSPAQ